jgi:uncharacterized membrane protein YphA (DoxX/SURF4 family)
MNIWTRIGLVLLRVVIGWHFLFEGLEKLDPADQGVREGKLPWSAEGYLRESQGPLAGWFRTQAGDADADALAQLTPSQPDKLPEVVADKWQQEYDRFVKHYELAPPAAALWSTIDRRARSSLKWEELQATLVKEDFELAKQRAVTWFSQGQREVASKLPGVSEKIKETTPGRIQLYRKKLDQLQDIEQEGMPAFGQDVWKDNYRALKKEIATLRIELVADLNKPFKDAMTASKARLNSEQLKRSPVPAEPAATTNLERINFVTRWGVTLVGACLILGLFTRLSCVAGAGFLLMFYLAMPALPWLPANPRAEGHYLFINKNIIEMVALLALATTPSGRWLGLDGLIHYFNPFRKRETQPANRTTVPARAA